MRILVQVQTWNDAADIGNALETISRQTAAVKDILVVDNASTDGTSELAFPDGVTVIRRNVNLGSSGAVATGLEYARAHGYQWMWVLDADSLPRPDALALLIDVVSDIGARDASRPIGIVSCSHSLRKRQKVVRGGLLTPGGMRQPPLPPDSDYIPCNSVIWSGALINVAVVEKVGLPRAGTRGCWEDFSLDYGDHEFSYRIDRAGYDIIVHRNSIMDHRFGRPVHRRLLGRDIYTTNHSAFRRYVYFRNLLFFWLRIYPRKNWPVLAAWLVYHFSVIIAEIVLLEHGRRAKLKACILGIRDGLGGHLERNFEA